ncbi:MAG: dipeptidyl aminopeptidase/acylaminoacyl peptidase [Planctomycetota bacterium]|jgi:dienelactone hydrolase
MNGPIESIPFELVIPTDPTRILRGVIDQPAGTRQGGIELPTVFVLHGFKGFFRWGFFPEIGRRLASSGYVSVRFNFSGSGVGPDLENFTDEAAFEANTVTRERDDAAFAIRTLMGPDYPWISSSSIGLLGHSMGGGIAMLLAAGASPLPIRALVTWGAISSFDRFSDEQKATMRDQGWLPVPNARTGQVHRVGRAWVDELEAPGSSLDPVEACRVLRTPTLLLHGGADTSVPIAEGERLAGALNMDVGCLETLAGAGHTFGASHPFGEVSPDLERALDLSLAHLGQHLG